MAGGVAEISTWVGDIHPARSRAANRSGISRPAQAAMREAMGKRYFALSQKEMHAPESPVASDGQGHFAAWSCKAHDCGDNQMTVVFDAAAGNAQVCWRARRGDQVQDLWLAGGKSRPLPQDACQSSESDPFTSFKRYGRGSGKS